MKIIDLLNKIANGEFLPKKIKYDDEIFIYDNRVDKYWSIDHTNNLYDILSRYVGIALNDEVEIIEEDKKIGKLYLNDEYLFSNNLSKEFTREDRRLLDSNFETIRQKFNEIIDYINKGDK